MNILLMHLEPSFGPTEEQLLALVQELNRKEGTRLYMVCSHGSQLCALAMENGINVIPFKTQGAGLLLSKAKLAWFLNRNKAGWIVHSNDMTSLQFAVTLLKKSAYFKLIHSRRRAGYIENPKNAELMRMASYVVCETQEIGYVMAEAKILPQSIKIIPAGIDPTVFPPRVAKAKPLERLIIGCATPLLEGKGHSVLLRALPHIMRSAQIEQWEVRFSADGSLFDELLQEATELGVEQHLAFLGDQPPEKILPECNLLVAPSLYGESNSMPIKYGWAAGVPVLCSDIMPHSEMATNRKDALFYKHDSPDDLAAKMFELLGDSQLEATIVRGGQKTLQNYSFTKVADLYFDLYNRLNYI